MGRKKQERPGIKSRVELKIFDTLDEQIAYQSGLATAFAGIADVIGQFSEYAMTKGKYSDISSEKEETIYKKSLALAFCGTAEVYNNFTSHVLKKGEEVLREKGWKGLKAGTETEDDLK